MIESPEINSQPSPIGPGGIQPSQQNGPSELRGKPSGKSFELETPEQKVLKQEKSLLDNPEPEKALSTIEKTLGKKKFDASSQETLNTLKKDGTVEKTGVSGDGIKTLEHLKQRLINKLGEKEGKKKFDQFLKLFVKSMVDQVKKASDRAIKAMKEARRETQR